MGCHATTVLRTRAAWAAAALLWPGCGDTEPSDAPPAATESEGSDGETTHTSNGDTATTAGAPAPDLDGSESGTSGGAQDGSDSGELPYEPAVYPAGRTHSPITRFVADQIDLYAQANARQFEDVFMKTGASSTVSTDTLHCFAGDNVDLAEHAAQLDATWQFFLGADVGTSTPFNRVTLAAQSGRHAGWAIAGDPSPIELEVDALAPRIALVHYGTNDMGWGATYAGALQGLYANMTTLLDGLLEQGIIPAVFGITRRGDNPGANRWVATYNTALRGLAQQRQIPFIDMHYAIDPLPGNGLAEDGLHLEAYAEGACILTTEGLTHGYNVRNLIALQALARLTGVLVDDAAPPDDASDPPLRLVGEGTSRAPWHIGALPWVATQDTTGAASRIPAYPACSSADESGPEHWYRFVLTEPTALRIMVLDGAEVDIDLQLLDASGAPDQCIARDDLQIQGTLAAGTYTLVADTWTRDGRPLAGAYTLLLVACDTDDTDCTAPL